MNKIYSSEILSLSESPISTAKESELMIDSIDFKYKTLTYIHDPSFSRQGSSENCIYTVPVTEGNPTAGEILVRLPAAAAVSVTMDDSKPSSALEGWWMRHPRSSIRLAALLVSQRENFGPYIEMLYLGPCLET